VYEQCRSPVLSRHGTVIEIFRELFRLALEPLTYCWKAIG